MSPMCRACGPTVLCALPPTALSVLPVRWPSAVPEPPVRMTADAAGRGPGGLPGGARRQLASPVETPIVMVRSLGLTFVPFSGYWSRTTS